MGILRKVSTDKPKQARGKPLGRFLRFLQKQFGKHMLSICWVTYILGFVWVLLHPAITITTGELKCRGTYISENALLVDSMAAGVQEQHVNEMLALHREFMGLPGLQEHGCGRNCSDVLDWIQDKLETIDRVEVYRQYYRTTSDYGENLYAILRAAPLGDHKESIALVVHPRNVGTEMAGEPYSEVSMGLVLLQFLVDAKWLAKDVIVLFADDGRLDGLDGVAPGTEAWLRAYLMDPIQSGAESSLPARAGLIRAAINLEAHDKVGVADGVGIFAAGMNGQLPNLDLINTAVFHMRERQVPIVLDRCGAHPSPGYCRDVVTKSEAFFRRLLKPIASTASMQQYLTDLFSMLRFMKTVATGPSGPHASFIRYNIDAVTLSPVSTMELPVDVDDDTILSIMRSFELTVRSLSNIEEKLHQSYFLYVLPSIDKFVAIGEYYYPVLLAVSPAILHVLHITGKTAGLHMAFGIASLVFVEAVSVLLLLLATHTKLSLGALVFVGCVLQAVAVGMILRLLGKSKLLSGNSDAKNWMLKKHTFTATGDHAEPFELQDDAGWYALKAVMLVLIVYIHCVIGIVNYPMALFGGFPMALFAIIKPYQLIHSQLSKITRFVWLIASSPLMLFAILSWVDPHGLRDAWIGLVSGFVMRSNYLALPYMFGVNFPTHTLAAAVWFFPAASEKVKTEEREKKMQ